VLVTGRAYKISFAYVAAIVVKKFQTSLKVFNSFFLEKEERFQIVAGGFIKAAIR
jgi:hypothetical protein